MRYREQLKDPRWIEKAKEVKARDNFVCQKCGASKETLKGICDLNVHHIRYLKNTLPWDYPNEYLITLCTPCHLEEHVNLHILDSSIDEMLTSGLFAKDVLNKFDIKFQ